MQTPSVTRAHQSWLARLPRRAWLGLLVVALGVLLAWLDLRDTRQAPPDPAARAEEPGHVIENAELKLYDDAGNLTQRLASPHITHTPQQAITRFDMPHATLIDSEQREWRATANSGTLSGQQQRLTLDGDTRLTAPNQGWQLDTRTLHYDSVARHAWSDTPALLQQPPQRMRAQTLDAWLDTSKVRLKGQVRGFHPPSAASSEESP
ncbi:LPS export ABC transporter periplasmic protein LptC [Halomonas piscis]|uniref:LPS export ABC transporter periplasmic protein LptC n=1 Tax=Halomonas piscis TaxID=3031727 RepID=A0ABY9Z3V4_9GAMM|nr:LPS export ABC transporter periplasmic protein LptC [Halomonas piscis]WNK21395.1 LPS export ABC transporter periplasmic protein LptC [Halomonas piscis]